MCLFCELICADIPAIGKTLSKSTECSYRKYLSSLRDAPRALQTSLEHAPDQSCVFSASFSFNKTYCKYRYNNLAFFCEMVLPDFFTVLFCVMKNYFIAITLINALLRCLKHNVFYFKIVLDLCEIYGKSATIYKNLLALNFRPSMSMHCSYQ